MKIVVDYDLCEANAVCMDVCPECFRVEDDDTLTILVENPGDVQRFRAEVRKLIRNHKQSFRTNRKLARHGCRVGLR